MRFAAIRMVVFGIFLHGATDNAYVDGKTAQANPNFVAAKAEL